ncbi:GNAT family N-acetyltransferase [Marispirochaeta sp.]|uniref:GNAT family N-acetyltransferase n=1 Tax=Marispirochaeta sp. TaxID=2038653 RepID=UPI0029C89838|nr:GNAT family N-acetyltransferase [Marispirochaeta sp.]
MKADYEIIDLTEEHLPDFCGCLTPDDAAMKEAGSIKAEWCRKKTASVFGAKLARLPGGKLAGMIQYVRADESPAEGNDFFFVHCIWIPPAKRNSAGSQRKKGMGKALLKAAEEEVKGKGAAGLAVWGTPLPFFMKSSWFRRQGYRAVDRSGMQQLLWKPFIPDAEPPAWCKAVPPDPAGFFPEKVTVTRFINGICPAMNAIHMRFQRAADELGNKVELKTIDTSDPQILQQWGQTDAVYINEKEFPMGPPPSYKKILKTLKKAVKRL